MRRPAGRCADMERLCPLPNGETLRVRPPKIEDAGACLAYMRIIGGETEYLLLDEEGIPGLTVEGERGYLASTLADPRVAMFLGFVGERLVAMFELRPMSARRRSAHNATISVSVIKDYWHMGVGSLAMEMLIDAARERGIRNLNLEVNAENARAIALYQLFGFAEAGRHSERTFVHGRYMDAILMDKKL